MMRSMTRLGVLLDHCSNSTLCTIALTSLQGHCCRDLTCSPHKSGESQKNRESRESRGERESDREGETERETTEVQSAEERHGQSGRENEMQREEHGERGHFSKVYTELH